MDFSTPGHARRYLLRAGAWLAIITTLVGSWAAAASVPSAVPVPLKAKVEIATFDPRRLADLLFKETNRVRKENRLRVLRNRSELKAAAEDQAGYMALMLRPTHLNELSRVQPALQRVKQTGLEDGSVAENVQMLILEDMSYEETAAALVKAWLASDDRANVLSREVDFLGCAIRLGKLATGEEAAFAVQVFYRAAPDPPMSSALRPDR